MSQFWKKRIDELEADKARLEERVRELEQERDTQRELRQSHMNACTEAEAKDAMKVFEALAGCYPTPAGGYGTNSSWAISDACRYINNAARTLRGALEWVEGYAASGDWEVLPEWTVDARLLARPVPEKEKR